MFPAGQLSEQEFFQNFFLLIGQILLSLLPGTIRLAEVLQWIGNYCPAFYPQSII